MQAKTQEDSRCQIRQGSKLTSLTFKVVCFEERKGRVVLLVVKDVVIGAIDISVKLLLLFKTIGYKED